MSGQGTSRDDRTEAPVPLTFEGLRETMSLIRRQEQHLTPYGRRDRQTILDFNRILKEDGLVITRGARTRNHYSMFTCKNDEYQKALHGADAERDAGGARRRELVGD